MSLLLSALTHDLQLKLAALYKTNPSRSELLADYIAELSYANDLKEDGTVTINNSACEKIANGREEVPIDEYIAMWQAGVDALSSGEPVDLDYWNY